MYTLMPPNCLSELRSARRRYFLCWVSSNANPRNGSKPQELWRSVKWDVVDFDFGMFLPTMAVRKTMKSKRCRFALLLLWVTGMVGEHPKSQCVGFDKAMYSNLGCPRGVDAWVRWRFVALVQAKKICDALAPWVLRDIEALNTVWALTFQRYGLLRLPNVQHKKLFTAFHVMSLKFSTTHRINDLFCSVLHPQNIPNKTGLFAWGTKKGWIFFSALKGSTSIPFR